MTDLPRWTDHIADRQINIVGRRNHGKTLLVTDLVIWLTDRGIRVGTLKHSSHVHIHQTHNQIHKKVERTKSRQSPQ